jgi:hypothetical protein
MTKLLSFSLSGPHLDFNILAQLMFVTHVPPSVLRPPISRTNPLPQLPRPPLKRLFHPLHQIRRHHQVQAPLSHSGIK